MNCRTVLIQSPKLTKQPQTKPWFTHEFPHPEVSAPTGSMAQEPIYWRYRVDWPTHVHIKTPLKIDLFTSIALLLYPPKEVQPIPQEDSSCSTTLLVLQIGNEGMIGDISSPTDMAEGDVPKIPKKDP